MKKFLKVLGIIIITIIVVAIIVAIFLKLKLDKIKYENVQNIEVNEGVEDKLEKYTNIALLGLDTNTDIANANSRSDCIMIISINNETKDVKIASVYRDTYLQIEGIGLDKVTHAYAYGKAPLALNTINKNLDLDIKEYVTINFESVIDIIDAIGGVTVEVTNAEAKYIPGISKAGTYNLNGKQALAYGRIRKIDTDYARTERMRTVLIKVFEKVKTISYTKIYSLVDELLPKVATNVKQTKIISYALKMNQYNVVDNFGWPYKVRGYSSNRWYAAPVTLEKNVQQLHEKLFEDEEYEVSPTVKEISEKIIRRTGYSS